MKNYAAERNQSKMFVRLFSSAILCIGFMMAILGWGKGFWYFFQASAGCSGSIVGSMIGFCILGAIGLGIAWLSRVIFVLGTKWIDSELKDE